MRNCSTFKGTIQKKANWRSCKLFKTPPITHYFVTLPRCVHIVKKSHKPTLKCGPLPVNKHTLHSSVVPSAPSQYKPNSDRTCTIVFKPSRAITLTSHSILTPRNLNSLTKTELFYSRVGSVEERQRRNAAQSAQDPGPKFCPPPRRACKVVVVTAACVTDPELDCDVEWLTWLLYVHLNEHRSQ